MSIVMWIIVSLFGYCIPGCALYVLCKRRDLLDIDYDSVGPVFCCVIWPVGVFVVGTAWFLDWLDDYDSRKADDEREAQERKRKEDEMLKNEGFPVGGDLP